MQRFWQQTLPTDPPTVVWLENPQDWMRTVYVIEQGTTRRTQVREPTPEELGIPGTERRDQQVCFSCRHSYPADMIAGTNYRGLPICVDCERRMARVEV